MPQRVICHKCSAVLYEGAEVKSPDEIISEYEGKCPNCRKKLSYIPKNFEVKPVEETKQLSPSEPEKRRPSRKKSPNKQRDVRGKSTCGWADSMRKQELKSRKKMHARKRRKKSSPSNSRKEITFERYRPGVITLEYART